MEEATWHLSLIEERSDPFCNFLCWFQKVGPISARIDDLSLGESARFESRDGILNAAPVVIDLTGDEAVTARQLRMWSHTPQQRLNALKSEYPDSSEAVIERRLRKGLQIKPQKTFYSSLEQNSLQLTSLQRSKPGWEFDLVLDDEALEEEPAPTKETDEPKREEKWAFSEVPKGRGRLLHPFTSHDHPASFKSLEVESSCISDWAWLPVLDAIVKFFSDTRTISDPNLTEVDVAILEMSPLSDQRLGMTHEPLASSPPWVIESGLTEKLTTQLRRLWALYPSQMMLFVQKQIVTALRDVRAKVMDVSPPPVPWTFWRRPDTPVCGTAPANAFNPENPDSWRLEEDWLGDDILSPTLITELTQREDYFVVPFRGTPLEPMDALAVSVLHRVMAYWEAMKQKIKPLAQIIDKLMLDASQNEQFNMILFMDPTPRDDGQKNPPCMAYYSYNPFTLPLEDTPLQFEWIFRLLFRTVILRHHTVRSFLRRACFIYRNLFSLDQPEEVAMMQRLLDFERDVKKMDDSAWKWKFRLSLHNYISTSRITHAPREFPLFYSNVIAPLLSVLKDHPLYKHGETLSNRWPILTAQHMQHMALQFPHEHGSGHHKTLTGFSPLLSLEFPIQMPMEWRLLRDAAILHPRMKGLIARAKRYEPILIDLADLDSQIRPLPLPSRSSVAYDREGEEEIAALDAIAKEEEAEANEADEDRLRAFFSVPSAVAGYVTPGILSNILKAREQTELDLDWSDDSDADYPDEEDDHNGYYMSDDGDSHDGSEHSEYEYYDSEAENSLENSIADGTASESPEDEILRLYGAHLQQNMEAHHRYQEARLKRGMKFGKLARDLDSMDSDQAAIEDAQAALDNYDIDWSKIDSDFVAAVMESSSREEIAKAVALRLGLGEGSLQYELADLIPTALDPENNRRFFDSVLAGSLRSSARDRSHHQISEVDSDDSDPPSDAWRERDEKRSASKGETHNTHNDSKSSSHHARSSSQTSKSSSSGQSKGKSEESSFASPFAGDAQGVAAVSVPNAPPPHPQSVRKVNVMARALSQRFDSDDEDDGDEELHTELIYNGDAAVFNSLLPTASVMHYPYSIAERLHEMRMNDPNEGMSLYKLKMTLGLSEMESTSRAKPSKPQASTSSTSSVELTASQLQQLKELDRRVQWAEKGLKVGAKPTAAPAPVKPPKPSNVPDISDTSKSVDDLLKFIEGPAATKGGKKDKKEKKTAATPAAPAASNTSTASTNTAKDQKKNAKATGSASSADTKKTPADSTPSTSDKSKGNANSEPQAIEKKEPAMDYPEFWDSQEQKLDEPQLKALEEEMSRFQAQLEASLTQVTKQSRNSKVTAKNTAAVTKSKNASQHAANTPSLPVIRINPSVFASIAEKCRLDGRNSFAKHGRVGAKATASATPAATNGAAPGTAKSNGAGNQPKAKQTGKKRK